VIEAADVKFAKNNSRVIERPAGNFYFI